MEGTRRVVSGSVSVRGRTRTYARTMHTTAHHSPLRTALLLSPPVGPRGSRMRMRTSLLSAMISESVRDMPYLDSYSSASDMA